MLGILIIFMEFHEQAGCIVWDFTNALRREDIIFALRDTLRGGEIEID